MTNGKCRYCGCTPERACFDGCSWLIEPGEPGGAVCTTCCDMADDLVRFLVSAGPGPNMVKIEVLWGLVAQALHVIAEMSLDTKDLVAGLRLTREPDEREGFTLAEVERLFAQFPDLPDLILGGNAARDQLLGMVGQAAGVETDHELGPLIPSSISIEPISTRVNVLVGNQSLPGWEVAIAIEKENLLIPMDPIMRQVNQSWILGALRACRRTIGRIRGLDRHETFTRVRGDGSKLFLAVSQPELTEEQLAELSARAKAQ